MKRFLFFVLMCAMAQVGWGQSISLPVTWLTQDYSGCTWSSSCYTNTILCPPTCVDDNYNGRCGPTCIEMVSAYYNGTTPSASSVTTHFQSANPAAVAPCGGNCHGLSYTEIVAQLVALDFETQAYSNSLTELSTWNNCISFLYDSLSENKLVIVNVKTQMQAGTPNHWMVVVGIDLGTQEVIVNDPGRSAQNQQYADHMRYSLTSLQSSWGNNSNRRCIVVRPPKKLNQGIPIYAGSTSAPKTIEVYLEKGTFGPIPPSFGILQSVKIIQGTTTKTIPLSAITAGTDWWVGSKNFQPFDVALTSSQLTGITNNGADCKIKFTFSNPNTGNNEDYTGTCYFFNPDPAITYANDVGNTHWYYEGVKNAADWSLIKGYPSSSNFQSTTDVNKERATTIIIRAGVKLRLFNMMPEQTNGTYADINDVSPSLRPYVQTYYNILVSKNLTPAAGTYFNPSYGATQAIVSRLAEVILNLTPPSVSPTKHGAMPSVWIYNPTSTTLTDAMRLVYSLHNISTVVVSGVSVEKAAPLWAFWNAGAQTNIYGTKTIDGTVTVKNSEFAVFLSNLYEMRFKEIFPNQPINKVALNANGGGNPPPVIMSSITDFTTIGDMFDNSPTPVGGTPNGNANGATLAQYSVASGGNITLEYPATNANSTVFYWSMETQGGTLISADPTHRKITYTAPTVTQPTTVYLYSYRATNAGKKYEVVCQINITVSTPPVITTPTLQATNITFSNIGTGSVDVSWNRGNGAYCILTCTDANYNSNDPVNGIVYNANSDYTVAPLTDPGDDSRVVYAGTSNNIAISGLQAGTSYRFKVYEYNENPVNYALYNYNNVPNNTVSTIQIVVPQTTVSMTWSPAMPFTENTTINFTGVATNYTSLTWSVTGNATIQSGQGTLNATVSMGNAGACSVTLTAYNSATGMSDVANLYTQIMTVNQILPDLVISSASVGNAIQNNAPFTINVLESNNGLDYPTFVSSWTKFYLSTDNIIDAGDSPFSGSDYFVSTSIPMNGAISFTQTLTIPVWAGTGNYYILIEADGGVAVTEGNENNNFYALAINVVPSPSDLIIQSFSVTPTTMSAGGSFTANAIVQNIGLGTASQTGPVPMIELYYSADNILDINDIKYGILWGNGSIPPSNTSTFTASVSTPNTLLSGTYYIIAAVDFSFDTGYGFDFNSESNESNNTAYMQITISNPGQPTTPTSNYTITGISANSLTFNWTNGNGNGRTVVAKQNNFPDTPKDNVSYTANSNFTLAPNVSSNNSKVVYSGTGNSMTMTGLTSGNDYTLTSVEYNNPGPDYLQSFGTNYTFYSSNGVTQSQFFAYTYLGAVPSNGWQKLTGFTEGAGQYRNNILFFLNGQEGFYVHSNYISKTVDGGITWTAKQVGFAELSGVWFTNSNTGWAVGANGFISKTTNGGNTWTTQNSGITEYITDLYFANANVGFVVTYDYITNTGKILKTSNGGTTWATIYTSNYALLTIMGINATEIWAAGENGVVYKTINGGTSWTSSVLINSYVQDIFNLQFVDSNNGWACAPYANCGAGNCVIIYRTTDGGLNWSASTIPYIGSPVLHSFQFTDAMNGYALGTSWFATTNDGGLNWNVTSSTIGGTPGIAKIFCVSNSEIFTCGYNGLYKTISGGQNNNITATLSNPSYCAGATISAPYTLTGTFTAGNTFTLELSDASGSFQNPTTLASVTSTNAGTLSGTLPANITQGTGYKVRITATNPVTIGAESSVFTISSGITAQITNVPASLTTTASTITMTGTPAGGTFTINGTAATQFNAATLGAGTHTVVYSVSQSGCAADVTQYVTVTAATVLTASTTATSICAGGSINVNYNAQGNYDAANYFTAELSDENGSFASPTVIGSFMNTGTGTLACTLPQGLIQGNSYRVRVVSSLPANVGSPSTIFAVQAAPAVSVTLNVSPSNTICAGDNVTFQATPTNAGTSPVYQWKLNGANVGTNLYQYSNNALQDGDVVWVEMTSNATCAGATPVVSAITNMNVTAVEVPTIESLDNVMASSSFAGNQWLLNGQPISGATGQFYEATQSGFYQVQVTINGCTAISTPFSMTYVGIEDIQEMQGVSLYPNPTYGNFTIAFDKLLNENANLEITNVLGQTLFQKELPKNETQHEFTVTEYAKGVYFINIRANGKVVSKKLILQ